MESQREQLEELERSLKRTRDNAERKEIRSAIKATRYYIEQAEKELSSHQHAVKEYQDSGDVRQALARLVAALRELGQRGLLQWDRQKNTYDLHPVIRGYAFDILEESERTDICNLIVDHFQSKPADRYAEAKTLADVQQSINIFRALVQSRRYNDAAVFIGGDLSVTLVYSVETQLDVLALLNPLFPNGFENLPRHEVSRFSWGSLMSITSVAFLELNQFSKSREILTTLLGFRLKKDDGNFPLHFLSEEILVCLGNLTEIFRFEGRIALSFGTSALELELAKAYGDRDRTTIAHLTLMEICLMAGDYKRAEEVYLTFRASPLPSNRALYRLGMAEEQFCKLRFFLGTLTDELVEKAEAIAQEGNSRATIRNLCALRGELALQRGDIPLAVTSFERVIEMAHRVGLPAGGFEVRLALGLAKEGVNERAREICDRLCESAQPLHIGLAEVYLEIGDKERARGHALEGYSWAWADGPPYARHWELERCREVLKALGEPEPSLPPFDPKAVEPVPYEKEIRALIADLKKKRKRIRSRKSGRGGVASGGA